WGYIRDLVTAHPLGGQHPLGRVALDHARHEDAWKLGERAPKGRGVARFDAIVQLVRQCLLELLDDAEHVDARSGGRVLGHEACQLTKEIDVVGELLANVRALYLDDDGPPIAQLGGVDLTEARRAERGLVEGGKELAQPRV